MYRRLIAARGYDSQYLLNTLLYNDVCDNLSKLLIGGYLNDFNSF